MNLIYKNETGGVVQVHPAPEWADRLELLAEKSVPVGKQWRIIEDTPKEGQDFWVWKDSGPLEVSQPTDLEVKNED
jgi:hypothetical protein